MVKKEGTKMVSPSNNNSNGKSGNSSQEKVEQFKRLLNSINLKILGSRLEQARLEKNIPLATLTAGLFSIAYYVAIERGTTRPNYSALIILAKRLDKPLEFFLH